LKPNKKDVPDKDYEAESIAETEPEPEPIDEDIEGA